VRKSFDIRIGGLWIGVKADNAAEALGSAIRNYAGEIACALDGRESIVRASEGHRRVTISIVQSEEAAS